MPKSYNADLTLVAESFVFGTCERIIMEDLITTLLSAA